MSHQQESISSTKQSATFAKVHRQSAMLNGIFCIIAFVLLALANNVLNTAVFPAVAAFAPYGREIVILFGATCYVGFYFLTTRRPHYLSAPAFTRSAALAVVFGTLLLRMAMPGHIVSLTILGLILVRFAAVWASVLLALALVRLPSKTQMLLCTVWGMALGELIRVFLFVNDPSWGVIIEALCYIGIGALLYRVAAPALRSLSHKEAPADVEVVNPESFLAPGNAVYLCTLVFNVALGFALTLNLGAFNPLTLSITAAVILAVAVWLSFGDAPNREDELFSFCVLIAVAGFLLAPFTFLSGESTANTLLGIGARAFELLIWLAVLSVGRRNMLAFLPTFVLLRAVSSLGTTIGAMAGHASTALVGEGTSMAAFMTDAALFVFIVILWLGFRGFSFSKVIQGVATLPDVLSNSLATGEESQNPARTQNPVVGGGEEQSQNKGYARIQRVTQAKQAQGEGLLGAQNPEWVSGEAGDGEGGSAKGIEKRGENIDNEAEGEGTPPSQIDRIDERCDELGKIHRLTPREIEIFALLARGRNGSFIMDHFVVSRNTAKSHIKHIYMKLGVHSQQELIDLVENSKS